MSIKKKGLLLVVLLAAAYALYSTYSYQAQDNIYIVETDDSVADSKKGQFSPQTTVANSGQGNAVEVVRQCENVLSDLLLVFPSTDVFLNLHEDLFDQWIFKNTELSTPLKHKVADTLGLEFSYRSREFDQHKRKPVSIDQAPPQHTVKLSDMLAVFIALGNENYALATTHLQALVKASPNSQFSIGSNAQNHSLMESILLVGDIDEQLKSLEALINSGYKISATDLIDTISVSNDIKIVKRAVDAYNQDLNFVFSTPYLNDASNLVLHSIRHNKIHIAEYFLSMGVDFNTDLELQRSVMANISSFPDDVDTNNAIERLIERGVFQFSGSQADAFPTKLDARTVNEHFIKNSQTVDGEAIFEELTRRFGEEKAKTFVASHNKQDLLSDLQVQTAAKAKSRLLSESIERLPRAIQSKLVDCKIQYADTLYSLQKTLYENRLLSLYDSLTVSNPELNDILQGSNAYQLSASQVDALKKLSSYAAKSTLSRYFLHKYDQWQREKANTAPISEAFQEKLESLFQNGEIDDLATFIENAKELSKEQKASMLFEIHLLLATEVNDFSMLISEDPEVNFTRMVKSIQSDNFDTMKKFAEHNVNIDSDAMAGQNLLWHAVRNASKESFDYLLANNARLQPANSSGLDALDTALENIHEGASDFYFVQQLLNNGHEIQASHKELLRAISDRHYDTVVAIIDQYDIDLETDP